MDIIARAGCGLTMTEDQEPKPRVERRRTSMNTPANDPHPTFGFHSNEENGARNFQQGLIIRRSSRGGKLRDFINMPMDIFIEVCYYFTPYDLRRLALTCKRLRDILMTEKARYIWRAVLLSVPELPECPSDLNEPQYVHLLYSSDCFSPDCTCRGTRVDFFHRVRFCVSCWNDKMLCGRDVFQKYPVLPLSIRRALDSAGPVDSMPFSYDFSSRRSRRQSFYVESVKEAEMGYKSIQGVIDGDKDLTQAYEDEMTQRFQERKAIVKSILRWKAIEEIAAAKQSRCGSMQTTEPA